MHNKPGPLDELERVAKRKVEDDIAVGGMKRKVKL